MAVEKNSLQTALDFNNFISKINNLYTAREHSTLYTLLRSVSHQYLKNTINPTASACNSIRLVVYQIMLAFHSQFCEPKKTSSKHIVYFPIPFVHKMQGNLNFRILNSKDVKSQLPLQANKFKIYIYIYIYIMQIWTYYWAEYFQLQ